MDLCSLPLRSHPPPAQPSSAALDNRNRQRTMEDDVQRLWHLLAELSSQLTQNREHCEHLKKQAEDLKTQAIHTGTGYALRRFNIDLSKEQFDSELERMNTQLVVENQTLQHENRQLTILLRDYETTLEQIMNRFRTHAHLTQQHELDLTKYYESTLLQLLEKQQFLPVSSTNSVTEMDPHTFQAMRNISTLIQKAMRELAGEEPYLNDNDQVMEQQLLQRSSGENTSSATQTGNVPPGVQTLQEAFLFKDPFHPQQKISQADKRRSSTSAIDFRPRVRDPSIGGYVGKRSGSLSDSALLNAIECERFKKENEYLRELLGISQDINLQGQSSVEPSASSSGTPTRNSDSNLNSHMAKLNSVVSEVIKEEDEEEEEESTHESDIHWAVDSNQHGQVQPPVLNENLSFDLSEPSDHSQQWPST